MSWTNYLEAKVLDHLFGKTTFTAPATIYVGLYTGGVAEDGTVTGEPVGNNYARVSVTNNTTNFPNASGGSKANGAVVQFNEASGSWGTILGFFYSDDPTAGNILASGALASSIAITGGDAPKFSIGAMTLTLD